VCSFWDANGGANAAFVVPLAELIDGYTAPPKCNEPTNVEPNLQSSPAELVEIWITAWRAQDDGIPGANEQLYYSEAFYDLPDKQASPFDFERIYNTKTGGVPYWTGNGLNAMGPLDSTYRLCLQIDNFLHLVDSPENITEYIQGKDIVEQTENCVSISNFCSDGVCFVFINRETDTPLFSMQINR
jgi:hypothetical protein